MNNQSAITVLISGMGGPTPRAAARSLKRFSRRGQQYRIIAVDCDPFAIGLYDRELADCSFVVPMATDSRYWPTIERIIEAEQVDVAVIQPEVEVEVWAQRATEGPLPCPALLPPLPLVRSVRDKALMSEMLRDTDLIPRTIPIEKVDQVLEEPGKVLGYPFWIRATKGTSGLGALRVDSGDVLDTWLTLNRGATDFMASEYLPGRNLACMLLFDRGRLRRAACAERLRYIMAKVAPSGITGNISLGRLFDSREVVEVSVRCVEQLCSALGVEPHGALTVDLKEDAAGRAKVTEVNARQIATNGAFAAGGVNFTEDMIMSVLAPSHWDDAADPMHEFGEPWLFLREVDALPILLREKDVLSAPVVA